MKRIILSALMIASIAITSYPQSAEVKISLNEQFFDAFLEAVFTHLEEPRVPLSSMFDSRTESGELADSAPDQSFAAGFYSYLTGPYDPGSVLFAATEGVCDEAVKLRKEIDGVRTAVRFRQGRIYAPIAFSGNYNPPLIGCIDFQGWAEANVELAFDPEKKNLVGNARVVNVNLSGTGGIGGGLIARMVQSSIDRKVNPIEIVSLDKLSFTFPVQQSGKLRMEASGIRHQVTDRTLDVFVKYEFSRD